MFGHTATTITFQWQVHTVIDNEYCVIFYTGVKLFVKMRDVGIVCIFISKVTLCVATLCNLRQVAQLGLN